MYIKYLLWIILLIRAVNLFGQEPETDKINRQEVNHRVNFNLLFNGIYPGSGLSYDFPLLEVVKEKQKRSGKLKVKNISRGVRPQIGFYHHPNFHNNAWIGLAYYRRKVRPKGFFTEFSTSLSLSRTFVNQETYQVMGNIVSIKKAPGYFYAMPEVGLKWGYEPAKMNSNARFSYYLGASVLTMYPYNGWFLPQPLFSFGTSYRLEKLRSVKQKIKKK
jgi:hypothetical protein